MVRNEEIHKQALIFRKRGFTYAEIAKICGVSKSTVSNWCKGKRFSKTVRQENMRRAARENSKRLSLMNKARKAERTTRYAEAVRSADTEFTHYKKDPAFMAALLLYRAQGDLSHPSRIRFTGNDPLLHRVFISFLERYGGLERNRLQLWLFLYQNHSEAKAVRHWARATGLLPTQFGKVQFNPQPTQALHNGTGNTIIGNTVLKRKLLRWIDLAAKEIVKK